MLGRARYGGLGHYIKLATATARWQPRSSLGWRGEGRRGLALRGVGPGGRWGAAWGGGEAGAGLWPSSAAGGAELRRRAEKQRGREEEDEGWTSL